MNKLLAQTYSLDPMGIDPGSDPTSTAELLIGNIIGILTVLAFIYFAIQVILAGYAYLTTQGDKSKMETARKRITEGILGIVIVVVALGLAALIASLIGIQNVFDLEAMFTLMGL
ncbi:hypothetical protein A3K55_01535 [Candidatus Shapirobacteria bacterium RBG_13_44_7]|uniref:Integral membrane protein n=1 Tax=Candidatus Shapirobacteria bacterium RBG_13_44_7 TaxID=1802149 RepID=A0A1F7SEX0_9BACT|nr:MAG: hypothetical protein A3K55_01535 [Candidatus Shapirobacteria bacterium RBG_13_44_7]